MRLLYSDTSALVRAYFPDEPDHIELRRLLLDGNELVITSELARVEMAGAVRSAERAGRLRRAGPLLDRMDADFTTDRRVALIRFKPENVLPTARRLVLEHRLRTLDALHLSVAVEEIERLAAGDEFLFVTRDEDQAAAATAIGFVVR